MRFLGSKFTQNALAAGALPRIPLGELKRSPDPLPISGGRFEAGERERRGKRERGEREKGETGIGEGKEEGKGREEGREGNGKADGKGGGVCVIGVRGDRRPCYAGILNYLCRKPR